MEKSYIFISYAHADSKVVLPIISAMQKNGIMVWYDNGIEAGSEWPEFIAQKIVNCTKFVSFISNAYINSQNCKRELNMAVSRNKELLSIYLEPTELPLGIELQLGTYQAVFINRFPSQNHFIKSICSEPFFNNCKTRTITTTNTTGYVTTEPGNTTQTGTSQNKSKLSSFFGKRNNTNSTTQNPPNSQYADFIFDIDANLKQAFRSSYGDTLLGELEKYAVIDTTVITKHKEITLPNDVNMVIFKNIHALPARALVNCKGLKVVIFDDSVQNIYSDAILGCENIRLSIFAGENTKRKIYDYRYLYRYKQTIFCSVKDSSVRNTWTSCSSVLCYDYGKSTDIKTIANLFVKWAEII